MQQALPWIIALAVLVVIAAGLAFWVTRPRQTAHVPLPEEWALTPRAVFSADERRVYRQLRDAFPQFIVLAKLPLVRFCQPAEPGELRYWFDLLGSAHVSFAVCSAHGRVLIAIDLDAERPPARRSQQIKQSVLSACRIRYLRCTADHLPTTAELQMLLPQTGEPAGSQPAADLGAATPPTPPAAQLPRTAGPAPASPAPAMRTAPPPITVREAPAAEPRKPAWAAASPTASTSPQVVRDVAASEPKRRKDRKALWQDSGLFQDSFFGIDNLRDAGPSTGFGGLLNESPRPRPGGEGGAEMLESARASQQNPRR
ncbi:MAG: DUF2726 domain-containing protein [Rubrivivax sp.]|nr:DUF2726 domain-containing protein [Rubrivivax sp.]